MKRLKCIIFIATICFVLAGCRNTDSIAEAAAGCTNTDSIAEAAKKAGYYPINDSATVFYYSENCQVLILNQISQELNGHITVDLDTLMVDGHPIYYDVENDCFTATPLNAN